MIVFVVHFAPNLGCFFHVEMETCPYYAQMHLYHYTSRRLEQHLKLVPSCPCWERTFLINEIWIFTV